MPWHRKTTVPFPVAGREQPTLGEGFDVRTKSAIPIRPRRAGIPVRDGIGVEVNSSFDFGGLNGAKSNGGSLRRSDFPAKTRGSRGAAALEPGTGFRFVDSGPRRLPARSGLPTPGRPPTIESDRPGSEIETTRRLVFSGSTDFRPNRAERAGSRRIRSRTDVPPGHCRTGSGRFERPASPRGSDSVRTSQTRNGAGACDRAGRRECC